RLRATAGPGVNARSVWLYFTNDGTAPAGTGGVAANGAAVAFTVTTVEWDDLVWGFVSTLEAVIPAQQNGVLIRYIIECDGVLADGGEGSATRTPYFAFAVDSWNVPDWLRDAAMYYV